MAVDPARMATEEVTVMTAVVAKPAVVTTAVVTATVVTATVVTAAMVTATVTTAAMMTAAAMVTAAVTAAAMTTAMTTATVTTLRLRRRINRAHHQTGYASGSEAIDSKQGACRCQVRQEFLCSGPSVPDHFISASARVTRAPQESGHHGQVQP